MANVTMIIQLLGLVLTVRKSNETSCGRDHSPTVSNLTEMLRTHVCHLSIDPLQRLFFISPEGGGVGVGLLMQDKETMMVFLSQNWTIH